MIYASLRQEPAGPAATAAAEGVAAALSFIRAALDKMPTEDRYELGGGHYILVQRYETVPEKDKSFEAHRRYMDIQAVVSGREFLYAATEAPPALIESTYDGAKDFALFTLPRDGAAALPLIPGNYVLLMPGEPHKPGCDWGGSSAVVKLVAKILVEP